MLFVHEEDVMHAIVARVEGDAVALADLVIRDLRACSRSVFVDLPAKPAEPGSEREAEGRRHDWYATT